MPSTFTWLDNSESDRRRALEVIDLFAQPGTLDELGIGMIRDALADQMFPGTSTIQTRARYFLFIPWIYLDLERRRVPSAKISELARQEEIRLARSLAENEADASGVIGKEAGRHLKRLPSAIYWSGLQRWGLRQSRASQDSYHRSLDRLYADQRAWREAGHDREGQSAPPGIWHPHIPDPPSDFPDAVNFALGREEVEYLQDRIRAQARGSLLAHLIDEGAVGPRVAFPWLHPVCAELPPRLRELLGHARNFAEAHHGAALLYNLMLAEKFPLPERVEQYREMLAGWAALVSERSEVLRGWDRERFWDLVQMENGRPIPPAHRQFVDDWFELLQAASQPGALVESETARQLIEVRERALKRGRARLAHREYLERWGGTSGAGLLNYRWSTVQTIVSDILDGLGAAAPHATTE